MNLQKFLAVLTPYSLVISLLYLFGYWSSFGVNVLEYIAVSDVLKSALYPLLYASASIVIGVGISNLLIAPMTKTIPPGAGKDLPEAKYVRGLFWGVFLLLILAILYIIFFESGLTRWLSIGTLFMLPATLIVGDALFAEEYIKDKKKRSTIVNAMLFVLILSFGWGAMDAEKVKKSDQVVIINGKKSENSYVGWAGNFLFLWNQNKNSIVAKNKSGIKSIELVILPSKPIIDLSDNVKKS